jgi:formiminotetrahydrofolate cyclodeaminase
MCRGTFKQVQILISGVSLMALKEREKKEETRTLSDVEAESVQEIMRAAPKLSEKERAARQEDLIKKASKVKFYSR